MDHHPIMSSKLCHGGFRNEFEPISFEVSVSHLLDIASFYYKKKKLQYSFDVDNCVKSVSNTVEEDEFVEQAKCIMSRGEFDLRNWEINV